MWKPDWFDLDNYTNMSPEQWAGCIALRLNLRTFLDQRPLRSPSFFRNNDEQYFLEQISKRPGAEGLDLRSVSRLSIIQAKELSDWLLVAADEEVYELAQIFGDINVEPIELYDVNDDGFDIEMSSHRYHSLRVREISDIAGGERFHFLIVDPGQDDEVLVDDFLKEIQRFRKSSNYPSPPKKMLRESDLHRWFTNGVLPAYDLKTWAELAGETPTQSQMADLLWPYASFNRTEKFRKTTMDYLDTVFTDSTLNRLISAIEKRAFKRG
jgi:hypothetical protein